MPGPINVLIQMRHTSQLEAAARAFSPLGSPLPPLRVPGCSMDMSFPTVQVPRKRRRERVGEREVGRLFSFDTQPEASTYLIKAQVEDEEALARLEEAVRQDPEGVDVFANPMIQGIQVCGGDPPVGTHADVERLLDTNRLHNLNLDGRNVLVAVCDTGINLDFIRGRGKNPDFDASKSWVPPGVSGTPGEWQLPPLGAPNAGLRHGTMVAYDVCIAAPRCTLLDFALLRSASPGSSVMEGLLSDAVLAYSRLLNLLLTSNPKPPLVVVNSWGMFHPSWDFPVDHSGNYSDNPNHPFNIIVESLEDAGADILFAAGNCGEDCPDGRCGQRADGSFGPAVTDRTLYGANSHPKVLTVGGVDIHNVRVGYSSKGPGRLQADKPDFCIYTHFKGSEVFGANSPDSGTSTACPVAAGVVAAIRTAQSPEILLPESLRNIMRRNADDLGQMGFDFAHGHGVVNVLKTVEALNIEGEDQAHALPIGKTVKGELQSDKESLMYRFKLGDKLVVQLDGPEGVDYDLYLKKGEKPTLENFDQRAITSEADEKITIPLDGEGDYFVMVHSFKGMGEFSLKADFE